MNLWKLSEKGLWMAKEQLDGKYQKETTHDPLINECLPCLCDFHALGDECIEWYTCPQSLNKWVKN
jgi:hypothetical protein